MNCIKIKEKFPDFLTGELDQKEKEDIQAHIARCDSCREELESLSAIWTKLGVIQEEQPSPEVRTRFYTMLEAYKQGMEQGKVPSPVKQFFNNLGEHLWPRRPALQFSLALIFLVVGLAAGYFITADGQNSAEFVQLRDEVKSMRQTLAVSLIDRSSPSERLRGVNMSYGMDQPDAPMLDALLNTLDNDPNVNVRLAAVDALYLFYDSPKVKEGLIQSLSKQPSPLVQVALINLMVNMQERQSAAALKMLIQNEELTPEVREHAKLGLQQLSF
ncbi:HEAT repeat domain-containing protein [Acidobacteriota bacterium]